MYQAVYHSPIGDLLLISDGKNLNGLSFTKSMSAEGSQDMIIQTTLQQLDEYFSGRRMQFDLPLQQEGTAFQQKVWNELMQIAYGRTISYHELSRRLGNTKAIRAAGTANGRNQLAIVVPCHRVIGSDGSLVGYAGELWRKKWLLEHEAKYAFGVQTLFGD